MNAGIRFGLSVALLSANLTGCASVSEETSRAALNAFIAVRPNVELHDLEIGVLSFWNNPRSALSEVDSELSRHRRRIHEEAVGVLARAKLIVEADLEELNEYFVEIDIVGHAGLTIPSLGRIYLREDYAADVAVLVHEIAHVATERQGYPDKKNTRFFLRPGGRPDPRFFDLDAFVAEKMLSEAEAEATERIAMAYRDDGSDGVESFWRQPLPADPPSGYGPFKIIYLDGTVVEVKEGEAYYPRLDLLASFGRIAYEGSLALVQARHREGEPLEDTLARMWSGFSYQTKEILFPRRATSPSRLSEVARSLGSDVTGALRAGAFLVWEMLKKQTELERGEATMLVAELEDDLIVRTGDTDFYWVTVWSDEIAAKRFATLYAAVLDDGSVVTDGRRAVATVGRSVYQRELFKD